MQNEVQNDPRKFPFCDACRIRCQKCRSHGAGDGCGTSTSVPFGVLPRVPPGLVPPSSCSPFPVDRFREFIAVTLVAVTQKVAVGTGQKAVFVLVPEAPDPEIAGDGSDIARAGFLESAAKELFCPLEFRLAWGGIAIHKGGCPLSGRTVGFCRKEDWEPVHEASFGCGGRVDSFVDPPWKNCFRHG